MSWNKGFTKNTHPSVQKISQTMREKNIDNFKNWREHQKLLGKIPSSYPEFSICGDLAELIGVVLGDGNISGFPRTERLLIVGNGNNVGFINRYSNIIQSLFGKVPKISKVRSSNALRISLYQKKISARLGIPLGSRKSLVFTLPAWIAGDEDFLVRFLRGLFEAEASLSIHLPTSTYNFQFKNNNPSLLAIVARCLAGLGYHPEIRYNCVRLRKKKEVVEFKKLIAFREY